MKQVRRECWKYYALLMSLSVGSLLTGASALAYQEVPVPDGGTITGKVTLGGAKPIPRGFNLVTFPDPIYCGRISNGHGFRLLKEFEIGDDASLKDVVVVLLGVQKGKPFTFSTPHIEARDCRFTPLVTVVRDHDKVE